MKAVLDGASMENREDLHDALTAALHLPDWYGRNLDALRDLLGERSGETEIVVLHGGLFRERLGEYAEAFFAAVGDACEENPALRLTEENEESG